LKFFSLGYLKKLGCLTKELELIANLEHKSVLCSQSMFPSMDIAQNYEVPYFSKTLGYAGKKPYSQEVVIGCTLDFKYYIENLHFLSNSVVC